jgi:hypothetical protein
MRVASTTFFTLSRRIGVIVLLAFAGLLPIAACADAPSSAPEASSPAPEAPSPSSLATGEPSPGQLPAAPGPPGPTSAVALPTAPLPEPVPDSRWQVEQSKLVTANAFWRRPDALKVDRPAQIGLGIQTAPLTTQINAQMNALPGTNQAAGQIQVSPQATAQLVASSSDAEVTPAGNQNTSFDQNIQMAWQWTVTPKRPTQDLILTAYVIVHLEGGPDAVITTPITLHMPVQSTIPYTLGRIFTNWGTWSAIAVAVAGSATWIRKRILRNAAAA